MPKTAAPDKGRTFDMHEAIGWEQRINKEDGRVIQDLQKERRRARRSGSLPELQKKLTEMPEDLRAICNFGIADHCLMTMRQGKGPVRPNMRLEPSPQKAHWVPSRQLMEYKPVFYCEEAPVNASVASGFGLQGSLSASPEQAASHMNTNTSRWREAETLVAQADAQQPRVPAAAYQAEGLSASRSMEELRRFDDRVVKAPRFRRHQMWHHGRVLQPQSPLAFVGQSTVSLQGVKGKRH
eukprot:TRINITY_DN23855_c0_g1_i1.p1 TRINITY_DN23855_c0_g1~~TRINITY_DN23855_c0_g1_i1.p1  ORF type:complete len:279 (-),score=52.05 TRINITY_DN23855_c0_g1_i1:31-747(-)